MRVTGISKFAAIMAIFCLAEFPAMALASGLPKAKVEAFHAKLLDVMKQAKTLGVKKRFEFLKPTVENSFDFKLMIALASGKHWRTASEIKKQNAQTAFARLSTATYADRFSGFSGQSFKTLSVAKGPRRTFLVRTQIVRPEKSPVPLTYVTRRREGEWRIVDVLVDDGISELAVRRSEYRSVLNTAGIDGLINLLKMKTNSLLNPKP